jgi:6-phosphogluconolactonase
MPEEFFYTDRAAMLSNLQTAVAAQLRHSLDKSSAVTLLLSGGGSPVPLYSALASEALPWDRIDVALVDERWVSPSHDASNERMVRRTLVRENAAACRFTGMKTAHELEGEQEQAAVAECNRAYRQLPKPWIALLGMGPDGHTASLFPGAAGLQDVIEAKTLCAAVHAPPDSPARNDTTSRMTLTPHALFQCERLFLLFTGRDRRVLYEKARTTQDQASLPISIFLQQQAVPLSVFWSP